MAQIRNTSIDDSGQLRIPSGTTAQRPASPAAGMIRYNTSIQDTEYYDGTLWRLLSESNVEATGGTIIDTDEGGTPYRIHMFTNTGNTNFVVSKGGEIEYLIVAGGGSGGSGRHAGGGGAGGLITGFTTVTPQTYTITVGPGGAAAAANGSGNVAVGNNGSNSSAFGLTAIGGGFGGGHPHGTYADNIERGRNGGSGGGGAHGSAGGGNIGGTALQPGSASGGFGNNGTGATNRSRNGAGGGAGGTPIAGFGGEDDFSGMGDSGGPGIYSTILPPGYFWAGGGGGSGSPNDGNGDRWIGGHGGLGGGGGGASSGRDFASRGGGGGYGYNKGGNGAKEVRTGQAGVCDGGDGGANTGSGGGGAAGWGAIGNGRGGDGGSGIVIVKYRRNLSSATAPAFIKSGMIGSTPDRAANNAVEILRYNAGAQDGVYWINLPDVGPTRIYCIMNTAWDGGGWMLALKATRGTTFNYSSSYWTTNNTLRENDLTLQDGDAKYESFNRFRATEILARCPDVSAGGTMKDLGGWIMNETLPYSPISLSNFFNTCPQTYLRENDEIFNWRGHGNNGPWSAQGGWRKYGFNLNDGARQSRWGFLWNNETTPGSNDVDSGIGLGSRLQYSAGDYITCCQTYTGVNRDMRVELYVR